VELTATIVSNNLVWHWQLLQVGYVAKSRKFVPAQPVDATPANRLLGQRFSQGTDLSKLCSIKPKQDSAFRVY
jgi:hypothetical protein